MLQVAFDVVVLLADLVGELEALLVWLACGDVLHGLSSVEQVKLSGMLVL